MATYYFSMSAQLWWVVLTISWYLSAGKKWGSEAIQAYSSYFHFLAWGAPALMSIAVLITHKVCAPENKITRCCFQKRRRRSALVVFRTEDREVDGSDPIVTLLIVL